MSTKEKIQTKDFAQIAVLLLKKDAISLGFILETEYTFSNVFHWIYHTQDKSKWITIRFERKDNILTFFIKDYNQKPQQLHTHRLEFSSAQKFVEWVASECHLEDWIS